MKRPRILVDLGAASVTPPTPAPTYWSTRLGVPVLAAPAPATPTGFTATPIAGGVRLALTPSTVAGAVYTFARADDLDGVADADTWAVLATQAGPQFTDSAGAGQHWYRAMLKAPNAQPSAWTDAVAATPIAVPDVASVTAAQEAADDAQAAAVAAQGTANDATGDLATLNAQVTATNTAVDAALGTLNTATADLRTDLDATTAQMQVLQGQVGDILSADAWDIDNAYPVGDLVQDSGTLYRALQAVPAGTAITNTDYWDAIGNYSGLGEAVAATAAIAATNTNANAATASDIALLGAHNSGGTAFNLNADTVMVSGSQSLSNYMVSVQSSFDDANSRIDAEHTAWSTATSANTTAIEAMQSRMPAGSGALATAASVTNEGTTRATADSALANRTTALETSVNDASTGLATKASQADLDEVGATVDAQGVTQAAHSTSIAKNTAQLSGGGNLISKGTFDDGVIGSWTGTLVDASPATYKGHTKLLYTSGSYDPTFFPTHDGEQFDLSLLIDSGHITSGNAQFILHCSDGGSASAFPVGVSTGIVAGVQRLSGRVTVPAGNYIQARGLLFLTAGTGAGLMRVTELRIQRVTLAESTTAATLTTTNATVSAQGDDIEANAQAISDVLVRMPDGTGEVATKASVDAIDNQINATYTLDVDVNGKVAGMVAQSDGTTSSIGFIADDVEFASLDGTFQIVGGRQIAKAGGYMNVTGKPFGVDSEFIDWYGPAMDVSACSRSNAISYKTKTGVLYVPAVVTNDIVYNAGTDDTSAVVTLPLDVTTTTGADKVVTVTYDFSAYSFITSPTQPAPAGNATLSLWRKIGSGAFVKLADKAVAFTGSATLVEGFSNRWDASLIGSGSWDVTDTDHTSDDFHYEWRLTARTNSIAVSSQGMTVRSVESPT